jgi:hypothetical protein
VLFRFSLHTFHTVCATIAVSTLVLGLSGCLKHTRLIERPQRPPIVLSTSAPALIQSLNEHYDAIHTLSATVLIRASVINAPNNGTGKGKVTDYTSIRGFIRLRQPEMLRVLGLLPVIDTRAFDMTSNGKQFTLLIPPKNIAIIGTGVVTKPSKNPLMNLRPSVFYDSLLIGKVEPDNYTYVTTDTRIAPIPHSKHLIEEPDYELGILRVQGNSKELLPERVIHISRTNLLPYQQDEYDNQGILVTRTTYRDYHTFDQIEYPTEITISRPIDGYKLELTIQKLAFNHPLPDDQFELKIPEGIKVEKLP